MNISEALKLLQDGKKIYHKKLPCEIYQLIDDELKMYRKYEDCKFFILLDLGNGLTIDCKKTLEGWYHRVEPIPISFNLAKEFYKAGKQIRRIGEKEWFSKYDLYPMAVTVEDIEANDWEVLE